MLWAAEIERMTPEIRKKKSFGPYYVTPDGGLRLPIENFQAEGPGCWPVGSAPGWTVLSLPDGTEHLQWLPLGSEFFFRGEQPISAHAPPSHALASAVVDGNTALLLVLRGEAFPFDNRYFVFPREQRFIMNSFQFEVGGMEPLGVFIGYRGHAARHPGVITPAIYRSHDGPILKTFSSWKNRSRIANNVLKQRFLEGEGKPLTELEAVGILQHHKIIGPTEMLDLTFDLNVAKWFALNEFRDGKYQMKHFTDAVDVDAAKREASCIYTIAVRTIGRVSLAGEAAKFLTTGIALRSWEGFEGVATGSHEVTTQPFNLGPLWSEYPKRQRGFGLRGIIASNQDTLGSILSITEHLFHPVFFENGWDEIGGPEFSIDGVDYTADCDSSSAQKYLFPDYSSWFQDLVSEVREAVGKFAY